MPGKPHRPVFARGPGTAAGGLSLTLRFRALRSAARSLECEPMAALRKNFFVLAMLLFGVAALHAASGENRAFTAAAKAFQDKMWAWAESEFAEFAEKFPQSERRPE